MKQIVKIIFSILVLASYPTSIMAQKYARNQFVIFSYTVDIDERIKKELIPYEHLIQYNISSKKQNKIEALLVHNLYDIITKILGDSLTIYFLPPNSMGDKASYTVYGYPNIVIQRAIRLSDVKYFMKIEASIENSKYDERGLKLPADVFLPVVNISIGIFSKFGFNPIQTAEGQAVAAAPIKVKENFFAGLNFIPANIKANNKDETIKFLFERAAENTLYSIKYRKIK